MLHNQIQKTGIKDDQDTTWCNSLSLFFKRWNQFLSPCSEGGKVKIEHAPTGRRKGTPGSFLGGYPISDKQASAGWSPRCLSNHISSHGLCS